MISVEAETPLSVDDVLNNAASGIGSQASSLDELPPTPDELFGGKLNRWTKPLRDAIKKMTSRKPPPPSPEADSGNPGSPGSTSRHRFVREVDWRHWVWRPGLPRRGGQGTECHCAPLGGVGAAMNKMMNRLGSLSFIDQLARNREIERLMHLLQTDPDKGLQFAACR